MKILKSPQSITLYSRPMCGWCVDAKKWLDQLGWPHLVHNTGTDLDARRRAIEISGQTLVPVIEVDGRVLGDFDTAQLEEFLKKHGYLA